MNNSDQAYESHILKIAINKYLDQKLTNPQKDLEKIELNKDEFVWDVVTTIYNQSGYKVSISFAGNIVEQRIKDIKAQLQKNEQQAYQEMFITKAKEEKAGFAKFKTENKNEIINFLSTLPEELKFDETKFDVFIKIHQICCEYYNNYECENGELDYEDFLNKEQFMKIFETQIFTTTLYEGGISNFTQVSRPEWDKFLTYKKICETLYGDSGEAWNLSFALEEEFEIEISDNEFDNLVYIKDIIDCVYEKITN